MQQVHRRGVQVRRLGIHAESVAGGWRVSGVRLRGALRADPGTTNATRVRRAHLHRERDSLPRGRAGEVRRDPDEIRRQTTCNAPRARCNPADGTCIEFVIDPTEVTRADYAEFLAAPTKPVQPLACTGNTTYTPDSTCMAHTTVCSGAGCANHPQVCVDWCDAYAYCAFRGQHLCGRIGGGVLAFDQFGDPARSEWTNVCTSGGEFDYPYGDVSANVKCNGSILAAASTVPEKTVAVGSLTTCQSPAAPYSKVTDLSGNVGELGSTPARNRPTRPWRAGTIPVTRAAAATSRRATPSSASASSR